MKLRANRPGRDTRDIRLLMGLCGTTTREEAETLYEEFYPVDYLVASHAHGRRNPRRWPASRTRRAAAPRALKRP
jgi:hypothetical protein